MIISGKELAASLKAQMAAEVATFEERYGRVPHLAVILVGEDPGSVSYVTGKAKASAEVGIKNTTIRRPETISEEELLGIIAELNADDAVECGIVVAEAALCVALHTEGYHQDVEGRRCRDRRQECCGYRPKQYCGSARIEVAAR